MPDNTDTAETTNTTEHTPAVMRINVRVPEQLWRKLRANALLAGETAEERVCRVLEEHESQQESRS